MCLSQNMHTHTHRHTHEQHTQKTHTQKSSPIPCARVLLVISNYLCLLSLFHSLRTQRKVLKSSFKKNDAILLRAPNLATNKKTKLKALFHKTATTTTHKKQILLSKKNQKGVCWGRTRKTTIMWLIQWKQMNLYKVHSLVSSLYQGRGLQGVWGVGIK